MTEALEETPEDITMEEATSSKDIDPRITEIDFQTSSVEELENFVVDHSDPTKKLQVGKDLYEASKEALKSKLGSYLRKGTPTAYLLHKQGPFEVETSYLDMEKLALSFITASKKLRPYCLAHSIHVFTNFLLRQVIQKPNTPWRLLKWDASLASSTLYLSP
ncbi:Ribonuclease H [Abeliophyllum distichum]|uniref:Ribonuclease H n=1 Tax=Abeliophyllum distichum TaxID=126358 RepID=A0ABD1Q5T7_9LAMI